jgi:hypothetical protein
LEIGGTDGLLWDGTSEHFDEPRAQGIDHHRRCVSEEMERWTIGLLGFAVG